jgi:hypothetical protein
MIFGSSNPLINAPKSIFVEHAAATEDSTKVCVFVSDYVM